MKSSAIRSAYEGNLNLTEAITNEETKALDRGYVIFSLEQFESWCFGRAIEYFFGTLVHK